MKRYLLYFIVMVSVLSITGVGLAETLTWTYTNDPTDISINNDYDQPNANNWYQLNLPDWYDSNYVTVFTIDMYGKNDDSNYPIDIWRKLGGTGATALKIAGFNVQNSTRPFILRMDLMDGTTGDIDTNYKKSDGTWTGYVDTSTTLNNISLASFDNLDSFLIGYACHFTLKKTELHIEQSSVPEPSTMLLLGFGLVGLAGVGRKLKS